MEKDVVALEKLLGKIDRAEKGLGLRLEKLDKSQQALTACKDDFFVEIEELRSIRHALEIDLTKKIENTVKESISSILPKVMPRLVAEFNEKTQEGSEACLQKASTIVDSIETTIKKVARFNEEQKVSMTWRRLGLNAAFCFSALLTAFGINYFWKAHINYEITPDIAQSFFFGEAAKDIYYDLTEKQRSKFINALNKRRREAIERK